MIIKLSKTPNNIEQELYNHLKICEYELSKKDWEAIKQAVNCYKEKINTAYLEEWYEVISDVFVLRETLGFTSEKVLEKIQNISERFVD